MATVKIAGGPFYTQSMDWPAMSNSVKQASFNACMCRVKLALGTEQYLTYS